MAVYPFGRNLRPNADYPNALPPAKVLSCSPKGGLIWNYSNRLKRLLILGQRLKLPPPTVFLQMRTAPRSDNHRAVSHLLLIRDDASAASDHR